MSQKRKRKDRPEKCRWTPKPPSIDSAITKQESIIAMTYPPPMVSPIVVKEAYLLPEIPKLVKKDVNLPLTNPIQEIFASNPKQGDIGWKICNDTRKDFTFITMYGNNVCQEKEENLCNWVGKIAERIGCILDRKQIIKPSIRNQGSPKNPFYQIKFGFYNGEFCAINFNKFIPKKDGRMIIVKKTLSTLVRAINKPLQVA